MTIALLIAAEARHWQCRICRASLASPLFEPSRFHPHTRVIFVRHRATKLAKSREKCEVKLTKSYLQVLPGPESRSRQRPSICTGTGTPISDASVGAISTVSTDSGCSNPVMPLRQNRIGTRRS